MQNNTQQFIKDKKITTSSYYREKLRDYILEFAESYFKDENMADSWCDFEGWPDKKTDRNHLCLPNETMLIDRNYKGVHTYCVCTIGKNRKITSQFPVIEVSEIPYGVWRNGYFLLPDLLKNHPDHD